MKSLSFCGDDSFWPICIISWDSRFFFLVFFFVQPSRRSSGSEGWQTVCKSSQSAGNSMSHSPQKDHATKKTSVSSAEHDTRRLCHSCATLFLKHVSNADGWLHKCFVSYSLGPVISESTLLSNFVHVKQRVWLWLVSGLPTSAKDQTKWKVSKSPTCKSNVQCRVQIYLISLCIHLLSHLLLQAEWTMQNANSRWSLYLFTFFKNQQSCIDSKFKLHNNFVLAFKNESKQPNRSKAVGLFQTQKIIISAG